MNLLGFTIRIVFVEIAYQAIHDFAKKHPGKIYLFLDEIQELTGRETLVNSCMIDFDTDIYITGSNAKMLSGELATYLGGRYVEFKIYPFSYEEVGRMLPDKTPPEIFQIYLL